MPDHISHTPAPLTPSITEIAVRLAAIEKWREMIDRDGLPRAFAVMEERQAVQERFNIRLEAELDDIRKEVKDERDKDRSRMDSMERTLDERRGGLTSLKTTILLGAAALSPAVTIIATLVAR